MGDGNVDGVRGGRRPVVVGAAVGITEHRVGGQYLLKSVVGTLRRLATGVGMVGTQPKPVGVQDLGLGRGR